MFFQQKGQRINNLALLLFRVRDCSKNPFACLLQNIAAQSPTPPPLLRGTPKM
jgi:hypothetical protein